MNNEDAVAQGREDAAAQEQISAPILKVPDTLGRYFRHLFDVESWGEADRPPAYRSGPVPKSAGSLAQQRLADPEARFHYAVMMAEVMLLPICVAHSPEEKVKLNAEIAQILGLDTAMERGWIAAYLVCWRTRRFPTTAASLRIGTAPGRRTREQVLGTLEPHIRSFIKHAQAPPYDPVHVLNARRIK